MKGKFNAIIMKVLILSTCLLWTISSFAAPPPAWEEDEEYAVNDQAVDDAPIDGFTGFLMAAGAIYGYFVIRNQRITR